MKIGFTYFIFQGDNMSSIQALTNEINQITENNELLMLLELVNNNQDNPEFEAPTFQDLFGTEDGYNIFGTLYPKIEGMGDIRIDEEWLKGPLKALQVNARRAELMNRQLMKAQDDLVKRSLQQANRLMRETGSTRVAAQYRILKALKEHNLFAYGENQNNITFGTRTEVSLGSKTILEPTPNAFPYTEDEQFKQELPKIAGHLIKTLADDVEKAINPTATVQALISPVNLNASLVYNTKGYGGGLLVKTPGGTVIGAYKFGYMSKPNHFYEHPNVEHANRWQTDAALDMLGMTYEDMEPNTVYGYTRTEYEFKLKGTFKAYAELAEILEHHAGSIDQYKTDVWDELAADAEENITEESVISLF